MGCYEDHVLLAYLDGELKSEGMAVESHMQQCERCQARLRELADDEQYLESVLSEHMEEIELDNTFKEESWIRLKFQLNEGRRPETKRSIPGISRGGRRLVAAAVVLLLIGGFSLGSVRGVVADLLSVFRMDRIQTITISPQDMDQIDQAIQNGIEQIDIENLGTFKVNGSEETIWDCSLTVAEDNLGFKILTPELEGYGEPQVSVWKYPQQSLTLNVPGINQLIGNLGGTRLLPQELDRQTIILSQHPQVILNYESPGLSPVSMFQMRSPELAVPGNVKVEEVRDVLLGLPFWPDGIRQQLAAINDWQHTMVIPTTADIQPVTVRGHQGITWNDPESSPHSANSTVLWSENGIIYSISGQMAVEQILEIAEGIK
jgi:anti-sigma factor RsiW